MLNTYFNSIIKKKNYNIFKYTLFFFLKRKNIENISIDFLGLCTSSTDVVFLNSLEVKF